MKVLITLENGKYRTIHGHPVEIEGDRGFIIHPGSADDTFAVTDVYTGLWIFMGDPGQGILEVIDGAKDRIEENGGIEEYLVSRASRLPACKN